jgi:hypothetical protein
MFLVSGVGNVREPDITSRETGKIYLLVHQCVSVIVAFVCLRSNCNHVTEVGGTVKIVGHALKAVTQIYEGFVGVILL